MNIYKFSKLFRESANWFDYGHTYKKNCPVTIWALIKNGDFKERTISSKEDFGVSNPVTHSNLEGSGDSISSGRFEHCTRITSASISYRLVSFEDKEQIESLKKWTNERLREKFGQITIMWKNSFKDDWQKI